MQERIAPIIRFYNPNGHVSTSIRMRSHDHGFSHGLKSVHRTLFAPVCALVPPFRVPSVRDANKKERAKALSFLLVRRKGLEPPTLGTGIRCSIH